MNETFSFFTNQTVQELLPAEIIMAKPLESQYLFTLLLSDLHKAIGSLEVCEIQDFCKIRLETNKQTSGQVQLNKKL